MGSESIAIQLAWNTRHIAGWCIVLKMRLSNDSRDSSLHSHLTLPWLWTQLMVSLLSSDNSQRHCWVLICCMHSPALSLVGPAQKIVTPWLSLFSSDYTTDITMDRPYSLHPQCLERRQNETYYKNSRVFPPVWALSEQAYKIIYRLIETTFDQRTAVEIRGVRLTWSGACVHLLWE